MAVSMKQMSMIVAFCGVVSFIFGVVAENKKPAAGLAIPLKSGTQCKYPSDPTVVLGFLSVAFLLLSSIAGYLSLFYPYKGKSLPQGTFFRSTSFTVFFNIASATAVLAAVLLLWPTIQELVHQSKNIHHIAVADAEAEAACPTAKTGVLGGGAFISLNASLFWLVSLMLADNVREDHFEEIDADGKENAGVIKSSA